MEGNRLLDTACGAVTARPLKLAAACLLFSMVCLSALPSCSQKTQPSDSATLKQLADQQQWQQIVQRARLAPASPDTCFYYGIALAQLGHLDAAHAALLAGSRQQPRDPRFPEELAGVAFRQKKYRQAISYLDRALTLNPRDSYAQDFLGTIYFVNGNLEAALKHWNRIAKPQVAGVSLEPRPQLDPELLDRSFAFSPASTLRLPKLLTSQSRVDDLGIFPVARFELQARDAGKFDLVFRNQERNKFGGNTWQSLLLALRGLPFESVYLDYYNLDRRSININSLVRWDPEKRRILAAVSGPYGSNPRFRPSATLDLRNENWDILTSFTGPAAFLGGFNLRRESLNLNFASNESWRWKWSLGAETSYRDFRSVVPGPALTAGLLSSGFQLKQISRIDFDVLRVPEHRFDLTAGGSSQLGKLWSSPGETFEKVQGQAVWHWKPQLKGDDYSLWQRVRAGKTFGSVPFDELSMLGIERDNDLWLRAHVGTRDGRKGAAPLGRNYFLSNLNLLKNVYDNGLFGIQAGPFLDTGRITDPVTALGSPQWLWDTGLQARFRVLNVSFTLTYGRDLRSGNNALYVSTANGVSE